MYHLMFYVLNFDQIELIHVTKMLKFEIPLMQGALPLKCKTQICKELKLTLFQKSFLQNLGNLYKSLNL